MVLQVGSKVDWLTITGGVERIHPLPDDSEMMFSLECRKHVARVCSIHTDRWQIGRPTLGYGYTWVEATSQARISTPPLRNLRQGWKLEASGQALTKGLSVRSLVDGVGDGRKKITRIDLAFDVFGIEQCANEMYEEYAALHEGASRRTLKLFNSPNGDTFVIGSRSSERYLRIYEKYRKDGGSEPYVRVELEMKGDLARKKGLLYASHHRQAATEINRLFKGMSHPVAEAIRYFSDGAVYRATPRTKSTSNRTAWFNGDVWTAIQTWILEEPIEARAWIEAVARLPIPEVHDPSQIPLWDDELGLIMRETKHKREN